MAIIKAGTAEYLGGRFLAVKAVTDQDESKQLRLSPESIWLSTNPIAAVLALRPRGGRRRALRTTHA